MTAKPLAHIVDDDQDTRESLRLLLESVDIETDCHASVDSFLAAYDPATDGRRPCCLLLDIRMPGTSGMTLLEELSARRIGLPVIVLTGYGDIPMSVSAMKLGAADFVTKPANPQQLLERVQEVLREAGQEPGAAADPGQDLVRARQRWALLTPREREVCERIGSGASNKQVAAELGISVRTVESHRAHIMEKLEASSLVDLVQLTLQLRSLR